jgi:hypothetical protein
MSTMSLQKSLIPSQGELNTHDLVRHFKGLSHEMDSAFDNMHGQYKA